VSRGALTRILVIAYQEVLLLRHNPSVLSMVFMQPPMMLFLFGVCISNTPANVPWVVLDQSRTTQSRRLIEAVQSTGYFRPPAAVVSYDEGRDLLRRGAAVAFLVVPSDFRRDIERGGPRVQVLLDGTDPITAARIGAYIDSVGASFETDRGDEPAGAAEQRVAIRQRFFFNPTLRDRNFFLSGLAGVLLTNLCLSATCLSMVGERENGTFEYMLASPTTAIEIVLGKLVPFVIISYVVLALGVVLPGLSFNLWPRGSWLALIVVTLPFVLASLSLGVFVSTLAATSAQAVFISVFFILPSFVLSGSMIPYQLMPPGVRQVGFLMPLRWYQIALRRVIERGAGVTEIAGPGLALFVMFGVILLFIRWRMNPRLG